MSDERCYEMLLFWTYICNWNAFIIMLVYVNSGQLHERMFGYLLITSNCQQEKRNFIGCICLIFLHYAFSNVPSTLPERMQSHIGLTNCNTVVWLFSTVHFQVPHPCLRRCIVTLVAFVWLFSTVRFQMCPQIACLGGCKVALVAFVWLFPTVCCQMFP